MGAIIFILMAWLVEMPLWLSIFTTIVAGLNLVHEIWGD